MLKPEEFDDLTTLVCRYGWESLTKAEQERLQNRNFKDTRTYKKFIRGVFKGWKKAQEKILMRQLALCALPNFHRDDFLHGRMRALQRLMDVVTWTHLKNDLVDIRRFYGPEPKVLNLFEHNISAHIECATKVNERKDEFALISDLTSGIEHGDLLVLDRVGMKAAFVEVKEGEKNEQALKALRAKAEGDSTEYDALLRDEKMKKQLERMERQHERAENSISLLTKWEGKDFDSGAQRKVIQSGVSERYFSKELRECADEAELSGFAIREVEKCLSILVMKMPGTDKGMSELERFRAARSAGVFEVHASGLFLNGTHCPPVYMQPLSREQQYFIVNRSMRIWIFFDANRFSAEFSGPNFQLKILTGKAARRVLSVQKGFAPIDFGGAILEYSNGLGQAAPLLSGLFIRVPGQQFTPATLAEMLKAQLLRMRELSEIKNRD